MEGQAPSGSRVRKEWEVKKETWSVDKKLCRRTEDRSWSWLQILGRGFCFSRDEAGAASWAREGRKVERGPVVGRVSGVLEGSSLEQRRDGSGSVWGHGCGRKCGRVPSCSSGTGGLTGRDPGSKEAVGAG